MTRRVIETKTDTIYPVQIGEFLNIPAWKVTGMVIDLDTAEYGEDGSFRALVQANPDDANGCWYTLEPSGTWSIEG